MNPTAATPNDPPEARRQPGREGHRFYDRLRARIDSYLRRGGRAVESFGSFLLLVPDIFILLWRLTRDSRVSGKNKVLLGSGIAYFIFPFDLVPEAIVGPIGYLDDLVFAAYILNQMLTDTDPAILHDHWSGSQELLGAIRKVLAAVDQLVSKDVLGRLRKMAK